MTTKEQRRQPKQNHFGEGPVWKCIVIQAIPLTLAQLVSLLYNVVDRIYLGHLGEADSMALTGVGLTFPIISLIMAFTALFGNGGVPLFAMARGRDDKEESSRIMGNSFGLLVLTSFALMAVGYVFCKPILYLFGASDASYVYAAEYLRIYLLGTAFTMVSVGMNGFINAQGFPKIGMYTTIIGAVLNIGLDPLFIFKLDMGVGGAALATVLSQAVSAIWVLGFLTSSKTPIRLQRNSVRLSKRTTSKILKLGSANFIVHGSNCLVQVLCNVTLQTFGGDLYVGIMTVLNAIREITVLPIFGLVNGGQPVISYNYGAGNGERVRKGIKFFSLLGILYTLVAWLAIIAFPAFWFHVFTDDVQMLASGGKALQVYFFGFIFMALQFAGQSTFQAVGDAKHSIFFSTLRKVIIVVPLTILLPRLGFGVMGVFLAEPISNVIGGTACYTTMWRTVYRRLGKEEQKMGRFETERAFLMTDFEMLKGVKTGAASGVPQPEAEKPAEEGQLLIALPKPSKDVVTKANVFDCIGDRESVRKYADEALTLEELSYLLWSTQGVRKITDAGRIMRTVPSAGGTNTFETYIFVRKVDGLAQGIYRYQPFEHRLVFLKEVEDMAALIDEMTMAERQPFVPYFAGKASVIFAWSTVPYRAEWKFDVQAHKKILIDVGHVCQNLYIAGESLDAGVCAIGIYNQNLMDQLLDLDGDEEMVIYLASAGRKAE